ncbi:hypothetical protein M3221_11970 [Domibacillus indicus]|uniref:hypothetical protein n=1 Tax=Domibacillus indicus TaxID=1437523 RepID=UPI00203F4F99|nr:hypothetical protein [Domibacillus indicus]MCM3789122.1 hypothetical protein [Domibacillus indicus]
MKNLKKYLEHEEREGKIFVPNEIFKDFQNEKIRKYHRPFAFSFYYLVNYLYRNAKYGNRIIIQKDLKCILGYSPLYKPVDYLIKKGGILEEINYIKLTREIPMSVEITDDFVGNRELEFYYYEEYIEDVKGLRDEWKLIYKNNLKVSKPLKAFHRDIEDDYSVYEEIYPDGTFYNIENTTLIPFEIFLFCMEHRKIGCNGFYLYSYLKMMNDKYEEGYTVSLTQLENDLGFSRGTLVNTMDSLKRYRMIQVIHNQEFFAVGLEEKERLSSTYITNKEQNFNDKGDTFYKKIKHISRKEYEAILERKEKEREEKSKKKKADIPLDALPY